MHTSEGDITITFTPDVAPNTVRNFMELVAGGMYTNIKLHRIIPGFVIQGGDPTGTGMGGPGYWIDLEASGTKKHEKGTLSMARSSDPDSAGSQFFICLDKIPHLDPNAQSAGYAAFGDVVGGKEVVEKIAATPLSDPRAGTPVDPPMIKSAELAPAPPRKVSK
ncbi:MAG: peptidylprolyl isomerase [Phycisphaera sp.]|nr:peptidylprolyl isomerase [Phycisphaera sp.]